MALWQLYSFERFPVCSDRQDKNHLTPWMIDFGGNTKARGKLVWTKEVPLLNTRKPLKSLETHIGSPCWVKTQPVCYPIQVFPALWIACPPIGKLLPNVAKATKPVLLIESDPPPRLSSALPGSPLPPTPAAVGCGVKKTKNKKKLREQQNIRH